jgi:Flp pilus assembly protein TadG
MKQTFLRGFWRLGRATEGIAAVEFALILPVILVLLFGTISIGRLLNDYHIATKSVRDATRYLSRKDITIDCATIDNTQPEVVEAKNLALTGKTNGVPATEPLIGGWTNLASITVVPDCHDNSTNTFRGFYNGQANIHSLVMTANVPFNFMWGWLIGRNPVMTVTITQKMVHFGT